MQLEFLIKTARLGLCILAIVAWGTQSASAKGLRRNVNLKQVQQEEPLSPSDQPADVPPSEPPSIAPSQAPSILMPTPAPSITPMPAPLAIGVPVPSCCPDRAISYRHHGRRRARASATYETCIEVPEPCTGCCIQVPVCLPCCCTGAPEVCQGRGLLGRSTVTLEWCCGHRIKVVFDRCGDLVVHSYSR